LNIFLDTQSAFLYLSSIINKKGARKITY